MASSTRNSLVFHMQAIRACMPRFNASAAVDLRQFTLEVRARNRFFRMQPQFTNIRNGEVQYSPQPGPTTSGFIGWRPYFNKRWPEAASKFAFKAYCEKHGLPMPRYSRESPAGIEPFLIKLDNSSFGRGMRGPFRKASEADAAKSGAYYEQYVSGRILKAYYWDAKLICLEMQDPPLIEGDGKRTVRELIEAKFIPGPLKPQWQDYAEMVAFQGEKLENALATGRKLTIDCRYASNFERDTDIFANVLAEQRESSIGRQLGELGPRFYESVPAELRAPGTVYSVDAMADQQDRVWLLEMNCNPALHPDVYFGMFEGLFGPAEAPVEMESAVQIANSPAAIVVTGQWPPPQAQPAGLPAPLHGTVDDQQAFTLEELLALARADLEAARLEPALRKAKMLSAGPAPSVDAFVIAARAYARLGLRVQAQDYFQKYLASRPDALHESFELGVLLFEGGELENARQRWQALLERAPTYAPTLFYSGLLAAHEGRLQDARRHLDVLFGSASADNLYVARGRDLLAQLDSRRVQQ
jgi:tetratricopeptide (TPR) repeat protein